MLKPGQVAITSRSQVVDRFIKVSLESTDPGDTTEIDRQKRVLERIAELYPPAWREVAAFARHFRLPQQEIEHALRRLVEEQPFEKKAWLARAEYAHEVGDEGTRISSLVSAVDAEPSDLQLLREVAFDLCRFIDAHKSEIPKTRRGVYLAGVRGHMEKVASELDATALSRLAWLFLLEDNQHEALKHAEIGLAKEPDNEHCRRIVQRLRTEGGRARR